MTLIEVSGNVVGADTFSAVDALNQIQSHCESPGATLGVTPYENQGTHLPNIKEFADGTTLVGVDHAALALLRTMPPGSVVGTLRSQDGRQVTQEMVDLYETVAVILEHNQQGTLLMGVNRSPRNQSEKIGAWGTYEASGQVYSEKADAINSLKRLLDPREGVEATQILSLALNTITVDDPTRIASEAGCDSHNQPKVVLPNNLLLGFTHPRPPIFLDRPDATRFLRVKTVNNGLAPIDLAADVVSDKNHLLVVGLVAKAEQIAATNPKNLGAGTDPGEVLEAILETVEKTGEMVPNGASVGEINREFRQNLGVRD